MLILGSKSERRKEILNLAKIPFKTVSKEIEENIKKNNPYEYAKNTALKKAHIISLEYPNDIVLSCDTIVVLNNEIIEKPKDYQDAFKIISKLQNKTHLVLTGVCIFNKGEEISFVSETKVTISSMTNDEIIEYLKTDEPYDKAGGYAIQGIFSKFVEKIEGDFYNVMGLPINEVYKILKTLK